MNNLRKDVLEPLGSVLCDPEGKAGIRGSNADNAIIDAALDALRAALAEPQPVHECADNDSPWLVCKPCAADGKCKQAEPQPKPVAWIDAFGEPSKTKDDQFRWPLYAAPQTQQTRYVKPWRKRLPRSPMNCSASEVVAAQQEEIAEWRDGHALQPLGYEQIVAIWSKHMKTRALPNYEDFARDIEAAHGIGVKNGPAGTSHVSSET